MGARPSGACRSSRHGPAAVKDDMTGFSLWRAACRATVLSGLLAISLCAHASIYTFVDEHGVRTFTDRRDNPRAVLLWRYVWS